MWSIHLIPTRKDKTRNDQCLICLNSEEINLSIYTLLARNDIYHVMIRLENREFLNILEFAKVAAI
jgi:hypothetical protein